jgi:hypothetical protein
MCALRACSNLIWRTVRKTRSCIPTSALHDGPHQAELPSIPRRFSTTDLHNCRLCVSDTVAGCLRDTHSHQTLDSQEILFRRLCHTSEDTLVAYDFADYPNILVGGCGSWLRCFHGCMFQNLRFWSWTASMERYCLRLYEFRRGT